MMRIWSWEYDDPEQCSRKADLSKSSTHPDIGAPEPRFLKGPSHLELWSAWHSDAHEYPGGAARPQNQCRGEADLWNSSRHDEDTPSRSLVLKHRCATCNMFYMTSWQHNERLAKLRSQKTLIWERVLDNLDTPSGSWILEGQNQIALCRAQEHEQQRGANLPGHHFVRQILTFWWW